MTDYDNDAVNSVPLQLIVIIGENTISFEKNFASTIIALAYIPVIV